MTFSSLGDLAQAFAQRHRNTELKTEIQRLNKELATGLAASVADHLGGSYARLTGIERELRLVDSYSKSIEEARQFTEIMQVRLNQVADTSSTFAQDLLTTNSGSGAATRSALVDEAALHLDATVQALNSQSAGRNLFSGDTTDSPALIPASEILDELRIQIGGPLNGDDFLNAIQDWFDDPAGFDSFAYIGSDTAMPGFNMSETTRVDVDVRANNPVIKDSLRALAIVALSTDAAVDLSNEDQNAVIQSAAEGLLTSQQNLVGVQARIGLAQEQISGWSLRMEIERVGLNEAKGALLAIDPYESASRLDAAQFQLESLYAVTVRLSQLSLVNFLR